MSTRRQLDCYLQNIERRLRLGLAVRGALVVAAVALAATVMLVFILKPFAFSAASLTGARITLFLALASAAALGLAFPWFALNRHHAARQAEAAFPQFQERLLTVAEQPGTRNDPFLDLLAADTLQLCGEAKAASLVPDRKLLVSIAISIASLGLLVWLITAGPGFLGYGAARLWVGSSHGVAPLYGIQVRPGNALIRRNSNQVVSARLTGFQADRARLYVRYQSASKWEQASMQPQPGSAGFQFAFAGLAEGVEYYVEAGPLRSEHFNLRVIDLPSINKIRVTYHFPDWTGLAPVTEVQGGDLRALEGTRAELELETDQPLRNGVLVLDNAQQILLSGDNGNVYRGEIRIEKDGTYHVAALDHGQPVRLSDEFLIEGRKANAPEVHITRPGRDYRASPIEEVTVSVNAGDEFGLTDVRLHYSVNGGSEQTVNMLKQKGAKAANGSTTIYLENFKVVPGDLISLYATAKDTRSESRTDMFFIQAEPFEREYSQSQMAGGGGMAGKQFELAEREKEIISATWKQQSNTDSNRRQAADTGKFLSQIQTKLRDQALSVARGLDAHGLTEANNEFNSFQEAVNAAAKYMGPAAASLKEQHWSHAIPSEQKALQHLLRAEATFRQIQVAFGNQAGGGSGGAAGRDLAGLFDLELDTEKNQYETGPTAGAANQRDQQVDDALGKLEELARREQELGDPHAQNSQDFQQRWQQEMLHREAEQLRRKLEQLAQSNQQNGSESQHGSESKEGSVGGQSHSSRDRRLRQALNELRRASEEMQRAASAGRNSAESRRAADLLRQASNMLAGLQQQTAADRLDSLARNTSRLADRQRDEADRLNSLLRSNRGQESSGRSPDEGSRSDQARLAQDRHRTADDLSRLEKQMQDARRELAPTESGAAQKLRDALAGLDESQLQSRLRQSAEAIRRGTNSGSDEPEITAGMQRLNDRVHEAQQALAGQQPAPDQALERVQRLREQVETLTRNSDGSAEHGQPGAQQRQAGRQSGNSQTNQSGGASDGFTSGPPGGPRGIGETSAHIGLPGVEHPDRGGSAVSIQAALQDTLRELNALRRDLRGKPEPLANLDALTRDIQSLGYRNFPGNPALVEQLRTQVLTSLDRIELQMRRDLDKQSGQIHTGDSLHVPSEYRDSVAEYFRRLSKTR